MYIYNVSIHYCVMYFLCRTLYKKNVVVHKNHQFKTQKMVHIMLINDGRRRGTKNKFTADKNKIGSAVKVIELVSKGVISCRFPIIKLM